MIIGFPLSVTVGIVVCVCWGFMGVGYKEASSNERLSFLRSLP